MPGGQDPLRRVLVLDGVLCLAAAAALVFYPSLLFGGYFESFREAFQLNSGASDAAAGAVRLLRALSAASLGVFGGILGCAAVPRDSAFLPSRRVCVASYGTLCAGLSIVHCWGLRGGSVYRSEGVLVHLCSCLVLSIGNCGALLLSFMATEAWRTEPGAAARRREAPRVIESPLLGSAGAEELPRGGKEALLEDEEAGRPAGGAEGYKLLLSDGEERGAPVGGCSEEAGVSAPGASGEEGRDHGWRDLVRLARPQRYWLAAACMTLLIRLPFSLAIPHFVSATLGAVIDGNGERARWNILCLVVAGTFDSLLDFWNYFLFGYAQQRLIRDLRTRLFAQVLGMEISFFDATSSGELTSRLAVDTSEMSNDLTWVFRFTIESLVRIGGITGYMLYSNWRLASVALGIIPVCSVIGKLYADWLHDNAKMVQNAMADANHVAQEALGAIRLVHSCSGEGAQLFRYSAAVAEYYLLNVRQTAMQAGYYMIVNTFLVNTCVQAAILFYGTHLALRDNLHPQVLIAFMLYQSQLQEYTSNLLNSFSNLIKSTGAGAKVFELLERRSQRPGAKDGEKPLSDPGGMAPFLKFDNVKFSYPTRPHVPVLKGISFDVLRGTKVALVGPSGSGKSTIFHILEQFYEAGGGTITVDGVNLESVDDEWLHRKVALVSQEPILFSGTIEENILFSACHDVPPREFLDNLKNVPDELAEWRDRVQDCATMANAHGFICTLPDGYQTEVGERGVQLSGGQKQRIAIARALLIDPDVLLLDEATSALDSESEAVVQEAIDRATEQRTTLVIAHRLSTIVSADKILVFDRGQLVESGTHDELMSHPIPATAPQNGGQVTYRLLSSRQQGQSIAAAGSSTA